MKFVEGVGMAESRRVKMTKRLIKDALVELLEDKSINKITVTDICSTADINRSTFYAYYEDVPMLLREIQQEVIAYIPAPEKLPTVVESLENFLKSMEELFDFVKENKRLFNVLIVQSESDDFARRVVMAVLARYPKDFFSAENQSVEYEYRVGFCFNGFIGIFKQWITEDFPLTSRQFAELALTLAASCADYDIYQG